MKRAGGLLGLARKAGKLSSGSVRAEQAARSGRAKLLIIACDASKRSQDMFARIGNETKVELIVTGFDKSELGRLTGSSMKSVIAIEDEGIADRLRELMMEEVDG